jgi:hypothetical protein
MFRPHETRMQTTQVIEESITSLPGVAHSIHIPAGYSFDGASIPQAAWLIIGHPFTPAYCLAACVHDWYCEHSRELGCYQSRVIGDAVFFLLLAKAKVPRWKRVLMYLAVRLYSWWNYGGQQ